MDRRIGGQFNLTNMLVELFTTLASCHTHLNEWIASEKSTIYWKGGDHPLEPACDNLPDLMLATQDLALLLASLDTIAVPMRPNFKSELSKKARSSTDALALAKDLAHLLADACEDCAKAIYKQQDELWELGHQWENFGVEDCSTKAYVIRSKSKYIESNLEKNVVEPAAFRKELFSHALAIPLGFLSNEPAPLSEPSSDSAKIFVLPCPNCRQALRVPRGMRLKLTCPRCRHAFERKT